MGSYHNSSQECKNVLGMLQEEFRFLPQLSVNVTGKDMRSLQYCCEKLGDLEVEDKYSKPLVWVGMYVVIASLLCILGMVADLLHGFRKRKLWFPCKYFSLNAASITVMAVAIKLSMDLSSPMPSSVDQAVKLVSMSFMYTIMANILPSLASMDNKTLVANIIGLDILLMTMIGNICIEIKTGVINQIHLSSVILDHVVPYRAWACFYVVLILWLLLLFNFSAVMIPTCKQILEHKYRATSKVISYDKCNGICLVDKIRQHVRRYWIMAETSSPQFMMASTSFSFITGLTCVYGIFEFTWLISLLIYGLGHIGYQSDYKWSIFAIVLTQCVGILVGSVAPIFRCFTVLSLRITSFSYEDGDQDMRVKKYWTKNLHEWKETPIHFLSSGRLRTLVYHFRNSTLSFCIGAQIVIGVFCDALQRFVFGLVFGCSVHWNSLKEMCCPTIPTNASNNDNDTNEDLDRYVLQLEDKIELPKKALIRMSNSLSFSIQRAEKEQPKNLLKLLEKSGFEGVITFDSDRVQPLLPVELHNWSLPVITLTCIAIALPNIGKDIADSLFDGVGEGLTYVHLVEESLNHANENVNIRKAAMTLWNEVEHRRKWLKHTLERSARKGKTSAEILKWFADKSKEIVLEIKPRTNREVVENWPRKLIVANSMYRIAKTVMLAFQSDIEQISEEELFAYLCSMISDILFACLTNIPRVIMTKCQEGAIENREASVEAAAKLLGKTTKIIEKLESWELPDMDPNKMAFIDEWRSHYKQYSVP